MKLLGIVVTVSSDKTRSEKKVFVGCRLSRFVTKQKEKVNSEQRMLSENCCYQAKKQDNSDSKL